ncbi:hypothetical protein P7K49_034415 [Saguinus oedipus]|uniref:Uncharacterized protein n=1 Tax=Saguinus oedipus TaxID=9490 RepID=A0ABQ9TVS1_SAGOE|nr:hypothetical protein P7K49_034415 [Saguinus oedipus]
MTSPNSPLLKSPIPPPRSPVPQASSIPPPPLPPSPLDFLAFSSRPWSQQTPVPPPPPLPPPPAASGPARPHVFGLEKSQLLKEALEKAGPVPKGREDVKRLLKLHKDRAEQSSGSGPRLVFPSSSLVALLPARPQGGKCFRAVSLVTEHGFASGSEVTCSGSSSVQTCRPSSKKALSMCPNAGPTAPLLPLFSLCWAS